MAASIRKRKGEERASKGKSKESSPVAGAAAGERQDAADPAAAGRPAMTPAQILKRTVLRVGFILGVFLLMQYYQRKAVDTFAKQEDVHDRKSAGVKCSRDYDSDKFLLCSPKQCGRLVMDNLVSGEEARALLKIAKSGMALGGSSGGATILDLHSGALSWKKAFVNVYKMKEAAGLFTADDFKLYVMVKNRIRQTIMKEFGAAPNTLHLAKPTFFSRLSGGAAESVHDEYWHPHVDRETYGTFYYTSLVYLTDYGKDFTGGRFVFVHTGGGDSAKNVTVEPRVARVSMFTSGAENRHYVERVESGERYALTVSFTCDPASAISDPTVPPQ